MHPLDDARIDWDLLSAFRFDEARFRADHAAIRDGTLTETTHILDGRQIEPATDVVALDSGDPEVRDAGEAALAAGEVASVVLNGGMATRFGGVVKGVVEVVDGKSFLALKAEDHRRAGARFGRPVPLVLMNSFATAAATAEHVASHDRFGLGADDLLDFDQTISVRLTPEGDLFVGDDGLPSYHAPGHGDFFGCLRSSGVLDRLFERGVRYLLFSNVDNLGATVDPRVVGHHVRSGRTMTIEVTEKRRTASGAWDKGGAPARIDGGRNQVVEGFRFPPDFAQEKLPDFSTNNMVFSMEAVAKDVPLDRYVVKKTVDGRTAVQLETITCEASGSVRADGPAFEVGLLRVPRDGPTGRFFPVKEPIDLEEQRQTLRARLEAGWATRDR